MGLAGERIVLKSDQGVAEGPGELHYPALHLETKHMEHRKETRTVNVWLPDPGGLLSKE